MKQQGFTLIELIVVITIIGILVAALAFDFTGWRSRYRVESQIKIMYTDLMSARMYAMHKNMSYFIRLTSATPYEYTTYEDKNGNDSLDIGVDTKIDMLSKKNLVHKITWNGAGDPDIKMDRRGMVQPSTQPIAGISIWLLNVAGNPFDPSEVDYDCIFLSATRINMGKYDAAAIPVCQSK
jgi:prepilin-type N-terminal cleavage/methylation domain-containing protein